MREYLTRNKVLILIGVITLILSPVFLFPIYQPFTKLNKDNSGSRISGYELEIDDNIAYVAADDWGLRIVDFSQPTSPKILSYAYYERIEYDYNTRYTDIAYEDSICYIIGSEGNGYSNLIIVNVSSPMNPNLLGFHNFSFSPRLYDIEVWNKTVFLGTSNGVHVYDVQDPANIVVIDQQGNSSCNAIIKSGDLLLSGEDNLLCIYRITQYKTLVKLSEFVTTDTIINDIYVHEGLACFTTSSSSDRASIYLIDITTPKDPQFIYSISMKQVYHYQSMSCYLSNTLYWGMPGQLLQYDISDQRNIEITRIYPVPYSHRISSISVQDNYIFLFTPSMIILSDTVFIGLNTQSLLDFWIVMIVGTAISYFIYKFLRSFLVLLKTYPLDNSTNLR